MEIGFGYFIALVLLGVGLGWTFLWFRKGSKNLKEFFSKKEITTVGGKPFSNETTKDDMNIKE